MANRKRKRIDEKKDMRANIRWGVGGILVLLVVTSFFIAPKVGNSLINKVNTVASLGLPNIPEVPFQLGLDLQGGAHLVYEADITQIQDVDRANAVEGARDVIERRVNAIGVGEPSVRTARVGDSFRINVELPGIQDVNQAIDMIGETPTLEFKEVNTDPPRELTQEEEQALKAYNSDAEQRANDILVEVVAGNFEAVAKEKSEDSESKNNGGYLGFVGKTDINEELYNWAATRSEGAITQSPIETEAGFFVLKRGKEQAGETFVEASHILICHNLVPNCTSGLTREEAQAEAQRIYEEANASNFARLAEEFSADPGSAAKGGDLGSFPRGVMVPEFEQAVFDADSNTIIGPVESDFGFHIIYKKSEEVSPEYELSLIAIAKQTPQDILPADSEWKNTQLSGKQLERAEVVADPNSGAVQVSLRFDSEGAALFRELTERNVGQPIAIFLDESPISVPTVQTVIANGEAVITGDFDIREAQLLAQRLNAGALPVPVQLVSQQSIGASLGAESLQKSLQAGVVALALVMIFMIVFYRLPGVLSVIALAVYLSLTLAIFKMIGVTLSLAGIAGLVLSIGMAVDANVLIFERLKEELRKGKKLNTAVEEGFLRAWTSIRDGNTSTLITCVLLLWFGSSFVQGFAITLAIGVGVSMFSAITVTRVLLRFVVPWFPVRGNALFTGFKKKSDS